VNREKFFGLLIFAGHSLEVPEEQYQDNGSPVRSAVNKDRICKNASLVFRKSCNVQMLMVGMPFMTVLKIFMDAECRFKHAL